MKTQTSTTLEIAGDALLCCWYPCRPGLSYRTEIDICSTKSLRRMENTMKNFKTQISGTLAGHALFAYRRIRTGYPQTRFGHSQPSTTTP